MSPEFGPWLSSGEKTSKSFPHVGQEGVGAATKTRFSDIPPLSNLCPVQNPNLCHGTVAAGTM
jgi:hypothetical protein